MTEKSRSSDVPPRKPEGPLIRADVVALVREYRGNPFNFALRTVFIESYDEFRDQWRYLFEDDSA